MRGIEINFIIKNDYVDNELFLDGDKERPDQKELELWLKDKDQTIEICLNEYLPDGEGFSFNDCFRRITISNYDDLIDFNTNEYKIF